MSMSTILHRRSPPPAPPAPPAREPAPAAPPARAPRLRYVDELRVLAVVGVVVIHVCEVFNPWDE